MKTIKFFRNLWRINGILIFLAASLAIMVLGFAAYQFMDFGNHKTAQVVPVDTKPQETAEPPSLSSFCTVSGTPFLRAALTFGDRYSRGSFSKGGDYSTRNYLFLDSETLQSRWLFPNNQQLIINSDDLSETTEITSSDAKKSRVIAFFYHTIDTDTNGDKQFTPDDKSSIAFSRADGRDYTTALKGIDKLLGGETIDNGKKYVVACEIEKKWYAAVISLNTFKIEKKEELPTNKSTVP